jgi:hypothetical protein
MIVPISAVTIELLAGCWAVSTVVGWLRQFVGARDTGGTQSDGAGVTLRFGQWVCVDEQ